MLDKAQLSSFVNQISKRGPSHLVKPYVWVCFPDYDSVMPDLDLNRAFDIACSISTMYYYYFFEIALTN